MRGFILAACTGSRLHPTRLLGEVSQSGPPAGTGPHEGAIRSARLRRRPVARERCEPRPVRGLILESAFRWPTHWPRWKCARPRPQRGAARTRVLDSTHVVQPPQAVAALRRTRLQASERGTPAPLRVADWSALALTRYRIGRHHDACWALNALTRTERCQGRADAAVCSPRPRYGGQSLIEIRRSTHTQCRSVPSTGGRKRS